MIKIHTTKKDKQIAEIAGLTDPIATPEEILDIMVEAGYQGCNGIIIHGKDLSSDFFDLKTGLAGEILQKFSNYRMRLAIIGDFSDVKSKSLNDFIRESNRGKTIAFVSSVDEALSRLTN